MLFLPQAPRLLIPLVVSKRAFSSGAQLNRQNQCLGSHLEKVTLWREPPQKTIFLSLGHKIHKQRRLIWKCQKFNRPWTPVRPSFRIKVWLYSPLCLGHNDAECMYCFSGIFCNLPCMRAEPAMPMKWWKSVGCLHVLSMHQILGWLKICSRKWLIIQTSPSDWWIQHSCKLSLSSKQILKLPWGSIRTILRCSHLSKTSVE